MLETISETEFAPSTKEYSFIPNVFVDISKYMDEKVRRSERLDRKKKNKKKKSKKYKKKEEKSDSDEEESLGIDLGSIISSLAVILLSLFKTITPTPILKGSFFLDIIKN